MENLLNEIENLISRKPNAVIGIDGYCASGKTTLAVQLAQKIGAQVIHMDDFFLPYEMRTEERLSETGGNVHYERFSSEVISGLESGTAFSYGVFNCKQGRITETKEILPDKSIIIEGSYAFHPKINDVYDLKIFVKAGYETRLKRIFERNGKETLEIFKAKWIPLENRYFDEFEIENQCDVIIG
ncbi:MAG: uridine kinase [Clostridia bacterium]|nr:uridine kinase [Clostridia bacterium]